MTTTAAMLRFTPGPMCPGLRPVGQLLHGGDRPHHVVVSAENLHALPALLYTHARGVDLICIDPPYSSGAPGRSPDGRCVNDSGTSAIGRWLAFLEVRLVLAKGLLKDDGVLVVTIGQHDVAALAVLLERVLPDAEIARVPLAIAAGGPCRADLTRVDQFAFFCFLGGANRLGGSSRRITPGTVWSRRQHTGGHLLHALLGADGLFPHAKSLYTTRDAIRVAVGDRPDAVVLDFFAGSGTTMHAVSLLNAEDGGNRQSISVTNNDLTEQEAAALRGRGLGPGDAEWDARGVFHRVTRPRIEAAITGRTPAGDRVIGEYVGTGRPMAHGLAENAQFFELTYEDPEAVRLGRRFAAVAPLLWMRAGARGERITQDVEGWALPDGAVYGVLFDPSRAGEFAGAVEARRDQVTHAFVVTDSEAGLDDVRCRLPDNLECSQLYRGYPGDVEVGRS